MIPERTRAAVGAGIVVLLAAVVALRFNVVLDISSFMLEGGETDLTRISRQLSSSEASRTLILLVRGPDAESALAATQKMQDSLQADPTVADRLESLEGGPPEGIEEAMWGLYRPRSLAFAATSTAAAAAMVTPEGLRRGLGRLKDRLRTPMSAMLSRVVPEDPLLVLPDLFDRLMGAQQSGLQLRDGRYLAKDGRSGVLLLRTKASPFKGAEQAPLLEGIQRAFATLAGAQADLGLQMAGLHRFSVRIERSIKSDITRVSVLSVLGLVLLFVLLFRSIRVVGLTLLIVSVGTIAGLAVTLLAFGRVHGLTVAFGASLIGVAIDYSLHFFVHTALAAPSKRPTEVLRGIWPELSLGALTTVAGFTGLAVSGLPGLREVAVFASAGVLAALASTWLFLPALLTKRPRADIPRAGADWLARRLDALDRARGRLWLIPVAALVLIAVGARQAEWNDDVSSLTYLDPALVAEEDAVRAQVAPFEQRRFVLAEGDSLEAALQVNERLSATLGAAKVAGELRSFRSLADLLPSAATQTAVSETLRKDAGLPARLDAAARELGFTPTAFSPFARRLAAPPTAPLTFEDLAESPLGGMVRPFHLELDGRHAVVSFLAGVSDADALEARVRAVPGARWIDQTALYKGANEAYRDRTTKGLAGGLLVVVLLVFARYRRLRATASALVPALLSVGLTVAALGVFDLPLNLVALTALLMVFSMGVDYGIFLTESASTSREELSGTLLAVTVAWASTLLGFGLLALSQHPAMRTIGVTASIGLTSSLLIAPTALILARRDPR